MSYEYLYNKYKYKYLKLKEIYGGTPDNDIRINEIINNILKCETTNILNCIVDNLSDNCKYLTGKNIVECDKIMLITQSKVSEILKNKHNIINNFTNDYNKINTMDEKTKIDNLSNYKDIELTLMNATKQKFIDNKFIADQIDNYNTYIRNLDVNTFIIMMKSNNIHTLENIDSTLFSLIYKFISYFEQTISYILDHLDEELQQTEKSIFDIMNIIKVKLYDIYKDNINSTQNITHVGGDPIIIAVVVVSSVCFIASILIIDTVLKKIHSKFKSRLKTKRFYDLCHTGFYNIIRSFDATNVQLSTAKFLPTYEFFKYVRYTFKTQL